MAEMLAMTAQPCHEPSRNVSRRTRCEAYGAFAVLLRVHARFCLESDERVTVRPDGAAGTSTGRAGTVIDAVTFGSAADGPASNRVPVSVNFCVCSRISDTDFVPLAIVVVPPLPLMDHDLEPDPVASPLTVQLSVPDAETPDSWARNVHDTVTVFVVGVTVEGE